MFESDGTAQRGFQRKAFARADAVQNPSLELNVYLSANFVGNLAEGARVQFGCAVVRVESLNAKSWEREAAAFAAAGRASDYDHSRARQS